jgi:hypothetical protein
MSATTPTDEKSTASETPETITGPHLGSDAQGNTHEYYRCTQCGLETTDETVKQTGCFRCGD